MLGRANEYRSVRRINRALGFLVTVAAAAGGGPLLIDAFRKAVSHQIEQIPAELPGNYQFSDCPEVDREIRSVLAEFRERAMNNMLGIGRKREGYDDLLRQRENILERYGCPPEAMSWRELRQYFNGKSPFHCGKCPDRLNVPDTSVRRGIQGNRGT